MTMKIKPMQLIKYGVSILIVLVLQLEVFGNESDTIRLESFPKEKVHLYLLAGQSNMAGRGKVTEVDKKIHPRVYALSKDGQWVPAVDPIHYDKKVAGVGLAKSFAVELAEKDKDIVVGLVPAACGGSSITTWVPGGYHSQTKSHPYDDAIERMKYAMQNGELKGILWHQGESDSNPEKSAQYKKRLKNLINRFRKDLNAFHVPFIIGQLGRFPEKPWNDSRKLVNKAHISVAGEMSYVGFVSSEGLSCKEDKVHFNSESLREFGLRYAEEYLKIANKNIPKTGSPIIVQSKKKPSHEWKPKETYTIEQLIDYNEKSDPEYSKYGGMKNTRFPAKGFFYTLKVKGRWWLIDPDGHLCIHKAICSVSPGSSENFKKNRLKKYGSDEGWAEATASLLMKLGFNGTAAWSDNDLFKSVENRPVYTQKWSFMSSYAKKRGAAKMGTGNHKYKGDVIYVFDPEFEEFADNYAKQLAATKDDPYLLGHFSDNEMPLRPNALELCLQLDKTEPGYQAAWAWLCGRKGSTEISLDAITPDDRDAFYEFYVDRYFSIVSNAIKKYDPNHLYLGIRLIGVSNNETVMRTYAKYADVLSMNWYGNWMLPKERMDNWAKWTDKPFIISEWYAKGNDVPGLTNESGAGWLVKTQEERGYYYQNMILNLLARRNNVGWHWFKYADNDPDDLTTDPSNRNANKGIVNVNYELYYDLTDAMKEINHQAYRIIEFFDDTTYSDVEEKID